MKTIYYRSQFSSIYIPIQKKISNKRLNFENRVIMGKQKGTKGKKNTKRADRKKNPLFVKKPRNYRVGNDIQPRRDLTRFVSWPRYILLQRQKRVLLQRLKVPPAINQFTKTLDKNQTHTLLSLLKKYSPETRAEKKQRLLKQAEQKSKGASLVILNVIDKQAEAKKPTQILQYGLNHITTLVENKKAKLVVIAYDVDPIELVVWLPQLCRKSDVPFCFVKNKARLGKLVHKKTATAVAITDIRKEDHAELENLRKNCIANFNDNDDLRKTWGGGKIGLKSTHRRVALAKALELEQLKKANI